MIYITPFRIDTLQATADSVDSGFPDIETAKAAMGVAPVRASERTVVYHVGPNDGIFFSHYPVRLQNVRGQQRVR